MSKIQVMRESLSDEAVSFVKALKVVWPKARVWATHVHPSGLAEMRACGMVDSNDCLTAVGAVLAKQLRENLHS